MELSDKVTQLEDEIKILKNEVQAVLLDLREGFLDRENPFNPDGSHMTIQPIIINQPPVVPQEEPKEIPPGPNQEDELVAENQEDELSGIEAPDDEPELTSQPEPVDIQELTASEETAREEVKRAWRPEIEPVAHFRPREASDGSNNGKVDLSTITGLSQWVAETVKRLGRQRTEAIIDISEMMGHMAPDLKNILVKFISPLPEEHSGKITTRDYLALLIELDSLLGRDNKSEVALLYILCQEDDHR